MLVENIEFKSNSIVFKGTLGKYLGEVILGILLSMITLGVYVAWFVKNLHAYMVDNSSLNDSSFKFKGTGGKLFVILLLTIMIPVFIFMYFMFNAIKGKSVEELTSLTRYMQLGILVIMIPYLYFAYKWMVNVQYKNYTITWETNVWESIGKIALEIFLSIITIGLYFPLAHLKLYKYFAERTIVKSDEGDLKFGYDIEPKEDYIFIFIQTVLSIITIGIYYPWAFSKIGSRILGKTYLEKV